MKTLCVIILTLISISMTGQTQADMNKAAGDSYRKIDKELNEVYKKNTL
jgi:hypothetical protein